jgi:drug/metabolite transporter (DMT)-like permease
MLLIVARGEWAVLADLTFHQGDLVMIVAVIVWGVYSVLLRLWRVDLHPIGFLTVTIIIGVVLLFPPFVWEVARYGHFAWEMWHLPMLAYLAIFPSILAFLFWNQAVEIVGPNTTGMFIYLVPVFTAGLASTLLGETLRPYHAVGGLFILAGLFLATRATSPPDGDPAIPRDSAGLIGGRGG